MPKTRLVAIDVDGTLLTDSGEITERVSRAVAAAGRAGVEVVLATGRRYRTASPLAEPLGLSSHLLALHGSIIKDLSTDETVQIETLDTATALAVGEMMKTAGVEPIYFVDSYEENVDFLLESVPTRPGTLDYVAKNPGVWKIGIEDLAERPIVDVGAFDEFEILLPLEERVGERLGQAIRLHTIRALTYKCPSFEVLGARAGKANALAALAAMLGIDSSETAAVGDGINDLEMLEAAGVGVAMGNASERVKAKADFVVASNNEDGVAEALQRILDTKV